MPLYRIVPRSLLAFAVLCLAMSLFFVIYARPAPARMLGTCVPVANNPATSGSGTARQEGEAQCDPSHSGFSYTNRLAAADGTNLDQYDGSEGTSGTDFTLLNDGFVSCQGHSQVHTFVYINIDGNGKSDTSSNVSC
jgi:hypothetical protein